MVSLALILSACIVCFTFLLRMYVYQLFQIQIEYKYLALNIKSTEYQKKSAPSVIIF